MVYPSTGANMYRNPGLSDHCNRKGFTLVEIVIVVIVLGILAAVVIPEFSAASTSARQVILTTQLQSLQEQIAYYKLQHNNTNPPLIKTGWTVLTEYTDINGKVSGSTDSTHIYGPYLSAIPQNPFTAAANASVVAVDPSTSPGWVYSESTGKFYATGNASTNYFNPSTGEDSATAPY
jgi:general secretion pathway protein G